MKAQFPRYGTGALCGLFGHSRQAYYQRLKDDYLGQVREDVIVEMVRRERKDFPRIGARKLFHMLLPQLMAQGISLGRDAFFDILRENNLLVRRSRKRVVTTDSRHWMRKYPNLVEDFIPDKPNQLWVSDMTYIETEKGFMYLWLLTDAYSRKIVGWALQGDMEATGALKALDMALGQLPAKEEYDLVHHSDRGSQYCSLKYVTALKAFSIGISMTRKGDPLENAIAERVNGILKNEWLDGYKPKSKTDAKRYITRIISLYNNKRPHLSIDMLTPEQAHTRTGTLSRCWKNYWKQSEKMDHV